MTETKTLSIKWTDKTVKVSDLKPYEKNPRKISAAAFEKLKQSLVANGYYQPIIAQPSLLVIGGHQRIRALKELGVKEITVRVPDRELTVDEFRRILVTDNLPFGEFDFEMLSVDFTVGELFEWGMPEEWLKTEASPDFEPSTLDEQGTLDSTKEITCPHCGESFKKE